MKAYITGFGFVLSLAVLAMAQAPSGSTATQPATPPSAQAIPIDATANPPAPTNQNDSMLQSQIENAIRNEPSLNTSHVVVNVSAESIDLSGTVGSGKDKLNAERIARSFDGNRKLNDTLMITGQKPVNSPSGANHPPSTPPRR
jgi:osmotically-inducible protein OsmY